MPTIAKDQPDGPTDDRQPSDGMKAEQEETRHYLGVTSNGMRVGTAVTGLFGGEHRSIPMSALNSSSPVELADDLAAGPLLYPVSSEVYDAFFEDDSPLPDVAQLRDALLPLCDVEEANDANGGEPAIVAYGVTALAEHLARNLRAQAVAEQGEAPMHGPVDGGGFWAAMCPECSMLGGHSDACPSRRGADDDKPGPTITVHASRPESEAAVADEIVRRVDFDGSERA